MRRLRNTAQVAFHCLRTVLHVGVAVSTFREVKHTSLLPLSQLCGVELVCRKFAAAVAALVQTLISCLFLSISHTIRKLGPTHDFGIKCMRR